MGGLKNTSATWGQNMETRIENLGLSLRLLKDDNDKRNLIRTGGSDRHRTNLSNELKEGGFIEILRIEYYRKIKNNIGLEGFWTDNRIEEEEKIKWGRARLKANREERQEG